MADQKRATEEAEAKLKEVAAAAAQGYHQMLKQQEDLVDQLNQKYAEELAASNQQLLEADLAAQNKILAKIQHTLTKQQALLQYQAWLRQQLYPMNIVPALPAGPVT